MLTDVRDVDVGAEPVVVFEVLSPSTALIDTMVKNAEYQATPSIRRYVMLSQDAASALIFARDSGQWVGSVVQGEAAVLDLAEIGVSLRLTDVYEGVPTDVGTA